MFGRQAIIHRHNAAATFIGQPSAKTVMGIQAAGHPASAMKKHQSGPHAFRFSKR